MNYHIAYQLRILVSCDISVKVGSLGYRNFSEGYYVYSGSARRALDARIRRHYSAEKKLFWHIDYLLAAENVRIIDHRTFAHDECQIHQSTPGTVVLRFGSSDCITCGGHLKYQEDAPSFSTRS